MKQLFNNIAYRPPGEKLGLFSRLLLLPLTLLSLLYGIAVKVRLFLYSAGILKTHHLKCKVISVGNITVGGTGKTPVTEFIASGLQKKGYKVAILSRGYKGDRKTDISLVSDGDRLFLGPDEAGDEPYMLAKRLKGVPVIVGSDRHKIGTYAYDKFKVDALILDDGFQHVRLNRDLNILLIDGKRGFGNSCLTPRGPLREPLSGIKRADLILINKAESVNSKLEKGIEKFITSQSICRSDYKAKSLIYFQDKKEASIELLDGAKVIMLSAIATPSSFSNLLSSLGGKILDEVSFPDHHSYRQRDLDMVMEKAKNAGADFIVTTEKDAVKLEQLKVVKEMPFYYLEIALKMGGEKDEFINCIIKQSGLEEKEIETQN
ncbi:MAG: tetraacyldisaccharide 4'-kinase [Proteobacteria bacterium]|nr:tetraacyldisaccharide 4'-kinase [Pseudomonadota bacterium]